MKLEQLCPELKKVQTVEDPITKVIYSRQDRRYKVVYKSGYTHVTADPDDEIIKYIEKGNVIYRQRLYASRRHYE